MQKNNNMRTQLVILFLTISSFCQSQADTIFTNQEKIVCNVKEVTEDAVKYSYLNEQLVITTYKNMIQKIVYSSGRVQTFSEMTSFKKVANVEDYENVIMSQVEREVKGLYKLGDVSSKAIGVTIYANQETVKKRAYRKLKIQAAMQGANLIYLTNMKSDGYSGGGAIGGSKAAQTTLSGVAYNNVIPNSKEFKSIIKDKMNFNSILSYCLPSNAMDYKMEKKNKLFKLFKIIDESGFIQLEGELEGFKKLNKFRVVNFTNSYFDVYFEYKAAVYNFRISFDN